MTGPQIGNCDYWVFPREKYEQLEIELKSVFQETKYEFTDINDGLVYLEITRRTVIPRSLEEFFVSLGGIKLNSRRDFEEARLDHEFIGSATLEDMDEIRNHSQE